jgi:hypothetical protein
MPARQVENIANHGGLKLNIKFCIEAEKKEGKKKTNANDYKTFS